MTFREREAIDDILREMGVLMRRLEDVKWPKRKLKKGQKAMTSADFDRAIMGSFMRTEDAEPGPIFKALARMRPDV